MKKVMLATMICVLLASCATTDSIRSTNRANLLKLSIGMTKAETLQIMGTSTVYAEQIINNPYRSEIVKGEDNKSYEVLYYYTDIKSRDDAITDDELTPLIFADGKLLGWGWSFLQNNISKVELRVR